MSRLRVTVLACGLLFAACTASDSQSDFVDAVVEDPTVLVQGDGALLDLEAAALDPGAERQDLSVEELQRRLVASAESDRDDELFILLSALGPTATAAALEAGGGDAEAVPDLAWLAEVDTHLRVALAFADYEPSTEPPSIETVEAVVAPGLVPTIAESTGVDASEIDVDLIHRSMVASWPIDGVLRERLWDPDFGSVRLRVQVLDTLLEADRLTIPDGREPIDAILDNNDYRVEDLPILAADGEPLDVSGEPVTVQSWFRKFEPFR